MSTQTVERFASIDDTNFDVYEIRARMFDTLNAIDPLLWIDLMNCDRLRGCPSYAAELLALDYARAIERKRPQTAEVLAAFYHNEVRPFLNGYYLGMFDPQFPAQEVKAEPVKPTEEEVIASPEFIVYVDAARAYDAASTIEELDRTTDTLMASREALAVVCRQYVHLIHACEKECKRLIKKEVKPVNVITPMNQTTAYQSAYNETFPVAHKMTDRQLNKARKEAHLYANQGRNVRSDEHLSAVGTVDAFEREYTNRCYAHLNARAIA